MNIHDDCPSCGAVKRAVISPQDGTVYCENCGHVDSGFLGKLGSFLLTSIIEVVAVVAGLVLLAVIIGYGTGILQ